jgi:hypothetical protein
MRFTLRAFASIAAGLAIVASTTAVPALADSASFYRPPAALPVNPGDIIRTEPYTAWNAGHLIPLSARATRIMYRSTSADGRPNAVTGTLLMPKTAWTGAGPRPIVAHAIGTHGWGDTCMPSRQLEQGLDYEAGLLDDLVKKGWAVVVTDYEGLGTPGDHTYMVGRAQGAAVLDSLRAATRVPGVGLSTAAPMAVTGYSQGGGAAAWAAEMQPAYAPELPIKGVAAGGVPADLMAVARNIDGGLFSSFLIGSGVGLKSAYPELPLEEHLNAAGRKAFTDVARDCVVGPLVTYSFKKMADLTTTDLLALPAWRQRIDEQRLGTVRPQVPVLVYHGLIDEVIPYSVGTGLRRDWCAMGAEVRFKTYSLAGHLGGMLLAASDVRGWLSDRFAGRSQNTNC